MKLLSTLALLMAASSFALFNATPTNADESGAQNTTEIFAQIEAGGRATMFSSPQEAARSISGGMS